MEKALTIITATDCMSTRPVENCGTQRFKKGSNARSWIEYEACRRSGRSLPTYEILLFHARSETINESISKQKLVADLGKSPVSRSRTLRPALFLRIAALFAVVHLLYSSYPVYGVGEGSSVGVLQGSVVDPNGALIPGIEVTATHDGTGLSRSVVTDTEGFFQFQAIPVGTYTIVVSGLGFPRQSPMERVVVEVGRTTMLDLSLDIGTMHAETTVTAPQVELTSVAAGQVINQRTVQEIPLNGRYFIDLGSLGPGSVTPPQNGAFSGPTRGGGALMMNTAGNREDTVNFQINGVTLNSQVNNTITFNPPITSIREFKIDNSTFSAEFGRSAGAVVNVATQSGTKDLHGEVFEYFRNDALDARNFFNFTSNEPPPFKRNQFGFALGGPLVIPRFGDGGSVFDRSDRTFFFINYEGLRQRQNVDLNSLVLSDAQRSAVTDPVISRLLPLIPRANFIDSGGGSRFVGSTSAFADSDVFSIDINHSFSERDLLHGYYVYQKGVRSEPTQQGATLPGFGDVRGGSRQLLTINQTHIFNQNVVNTARFGFNRISFLAEAFAKLNPTDFGINVGVNSPIGIPQISIPGAFVFGGSARLPQGRLDTTFVFANSVSILAGRHSLKIGGDFRTFQNNNSLLDTGRFNFPNVAAFLAGNGSAFSITLGELVNEIRQYSVGGFIQDSYRVRSNLTLDLGLRYDLNTVPTERQDRFVVFDPETASLLRVGKDVEKPYRTDWNGFQPRVGFAWDPFGKGKTSIRGAYAIALEQPTTNVAANTSVNPPLANPLAFAGPIRLDNAVNVAGAAGLAPFTVADDFRGSTVQTWNLNIQQEIVSNLALMVGYFGSKGTHLRMARNINQPINGVRPFVRLSAASPELPNALLGNIVQVESGGNSSYNAIWSSLTKRFSRGLQFSASYTWSKSIDYNSLSTPPQIVSFQDSYNVRNDRGLSDFDARHRFVATAIWELPLSGNRIKDGWQFGLIVQSQTGNPLNIVTNNVGLTGVPNTIRPDVVAPIEITGSVERWFEPASFTAVPRFGTLGRNVVIGPGFHNIDASITKNTQLSERFKTQFRWEVFDVLNTASFGQPGRVVGAATFGRITDTRFPTGESGSSRQMQFVIKFVF